MKYSQWIGVLAAVVLIVSCFLNWAYYPDLDKHFNGFFSEQNRYGKPGKVFVVLAVISIVFFLLPKVWAKRWNLLVGALIAAYAIRSFIIFSACYNVYCPKKEAGLWAMLISALLMLVMIMIPPDVMGRRTGGK